MSILILYSTFVLYNAPLIFDDCRTIAPYSQDICPIYGKFKKYYVTKGNNMHDVKHRIRTVMDIAGVKSRKALSQLIGVPYDTLNKWLARDKITAEGILKITEVVRVSRKYLETGEGDAELDNSGVSNYGHSVREEEMLIAYRMLSNEDKEHFYQLMVKLANLQNIDLNFN